MRLSFRPMLAALGLLASNQAVLKAPVLRVGDTTRRRLGIHRDTSVPLARRSRNLPPGGGDRIFRSYRRQTA
jgi:hypothetical protein